MMGALIRALTNNAVENIEEALGMTDATSSAMKHAIAEWYAAWYGRAPTKTEDPCQRLPYAIVNKLCKATFGEYDSSLQHTDSAKAKYLDGVRSTFDACKTSFMTQAMIGGEAWAKPVPMPDGRLTWQIVGRDSVIILGRDASGIPSDVALCEKSVSADHHFYTLVERRTSFAGRPQSGTACTAPTTKAHWGGACRWQACHNMSGWKMSTPLPCPLMASAWCSCGCPSQTV